MTSHLGTGPDPARAPVGVRSTHAWIVAAVVCGILAVAVVLAWTSSSSSGDGASSRTIQDVQLEDDVTSSPVGEEFRPVMRRVAPKPPRTRTPAATSRRTGGTGGGATGTRGPSGGTGGGGGGNTGGGGTTVRPPSGGGGGTGGGGGGTTTPTPTQPQPDTAVPVVNLPPQAVGPVSTPGVAVGITGTGPVPESVNVTVGETHVNLGQD